MRRNRSPPRPPGTTRLPDQVTIRDYREEDAEGLLEVLRDLQRWERQFSRWTRPADEMGRWYIDGLKRDTEGGRGCILVAETGGRILGYASLLYAVSALDEPDEIPHAYACVGDLAVLESHRGKGIGGRLLADCEARARQSGQSWLRLGVLAGNAAARRFYERHGLTPLLLTLEKQL